MKKGAGTTMASLLMIVILLAGISLHYATVLKKTGQQQKINMRESEIMRTVNAFHLLNRSLGMTWYLSTIQSVFQTGDESIGCGTDEDPNIYTTSKTNIGDIYWYQTDPTRDKTSKKFDEKEYYSKDPGPGAPRFPPPDKYNQWSYNPRICYPKTNNVNDFFLEKIGPFQDITKSFDANGIDSINIDNIKTEFDFSLVRRNIKSTTEQDIAMKYGNTEISTKAKNENTVYTEFPPMVFAAQDFVSSLMDLSDALINDVERDANGQTTYKDKEFRYGMRYQDVDIEQISGGSLKPTQSHDIYTQLIEGFIARKLAAIKSSYGLGNTEIIYYKNDFGLKAATENDRASTRLQENGGLVFHYNLDVRFVEKYNDNAIQGNECQKPPEEYESIIDGAAADWDITYSTATVKFNKEEVKSLIKSIIQKESAWKADAISPKGALGLMQLMPSTASSECGLYLSEDLMNTQNNTECGTKYFKKMLETFIAYTDKKEDLLRIALAGYNHGPDNVKNLIKQPTAAWDDIEQSLPAETQNYVTAVLSCNDYYSEPQLDDNYLPPSSGQTITYDWPTESRSIIKCIDEEWQHHFGAGTDTSAEKGHEGIDIEYAETKSADVKSVSDGTVIDVLDSCTKGDIHCGEGWGNYIRIESNDADKKIFRYSGLENIKVSKGDSVIKEQIIAEMGNTGNSRISADSKYLHFGIRDSNGNRIDPCTLMDCKQSTKKSCQNVIDYADMQANENYGWPTGSRKLAGCFNEIRGDETQKGIDISYDSLLPKSENNIIWNSSSKGTVKKIANNCESGDEKCNNGYGNYVEIENSGRIFRYAHLGTIMAAENTDVSEGDIIAEMGSIDGKKHFRLEIEKNGKKIDPCLLIDCRQSTKLFCQPDTDYSAYKNLYYYYNEEENYFTQRPIELRFKVEDYLPVLDCYDRPKQFFPVEPGIRLFSWNKPGDMACCGGNLWTCDMNENELPKLDKEYYIENGKYLNEIAENMGEKGIGCKNALGERFPEMKTKVLCQNGVFCIEQNGVCQ